MASQRMIMLPALPIVALVLLAFPPVLYGQISTSPSPCTTSMLTSFTPCMNFITNSSVNGTSPTADCCNVLKTVMSNGTGCLCLIATGSVPFNIPINRTLALSLPRACNMPAGVPLQCKASVAGAPAPGPEASSPTVSPAASPSPSASIVPLGGSPTLSPEAPAIPALEPPTATTNPGNRQSVPPSAASTKSFSPLLALAFIGAIALKNY